MNNKLASYLIIHSLLFLFTFQVLTEARSEENNIGASVETYLKQIKDYQRSGRYQDAITEAQMLVQYAPSDVRGYTKLRFLYALRGRYEDAFDAGKKIIEIRNNKNLSPCGDIKFQAAILEYSGQQNDAINFLESYRITCPDTVKTLVEGLQKAIAEGTTYFSPVPKH